MKSSRNSASTTDESLEKPSSQESSSSTKRSPMSRSASCSSDEDDENEENREKKRKKENFNDTFDLQENVDYFSFEESDPFPLKYIRQLKKEIVFKEVKVKHSKERLSKPCNFVCLLCLKEGRKRAAFILKGEFNPIKKTGRTSNFGSHLVSAHGIHNSDSEVKPNNSTSSKTSAERVFQESVATYLIQDERPLNTVNKPSFKDMFARGRCILKFQAGISLTKFATSGSKSSRS
jgi:hypothetical protein